MKKILKYSLLAVLGLAMVAMTGCRKDELDTDQFGGFSLAAIAPNPVMRGGELRLLGSGLENAKEVRFAGNVTITDITVVEKGERSEIRVTVPVEGPEVGPVSVVDAEGNIRSTKANLTFTEPITLESFSPATVLSGDVVTIKGEYLNNVKEVIFGGGNYVTEFVSQDRHELKVIVPSKAVTGFIILGDVNELEDENTIPNQIYSATELMVGKPTVTTAAKATYKSGEVITVKGAHLDMINILNLAGASNVEFKVADDGKSLTFPLPITATDGHITLISYAGDSFDAGEIVTVTVTDLGIVSKASDGRFKAGTDVEITGEDLDLVEKVDFVNASAEWYLSGKKIIATIPAAAKDGNVTVSLASGKQAFTEEIEVVKPAVSSIELPEGAVVAGESVIIVKGEDLDLVTGATIGDKAHGFIPCEFELKHDEANNAYLEVPMPREAYTGVITLTADSGYQAVTESVEVTYDEAVSISFVKAPFGLGSKINLSGKNLLQIEQVFIKGKKVVDFAVRADDKMSFGIPEKVGPGVYRLDLVLVDGTELTWPIPFEITAPFTETFIWEGYEDLGFWDNQPYLGAEGALTEAGIVEGDVIRIYFTPLADNWEFETYAGHWDVLALDELGGDKTVNASTIDPTPGYFAFTVTAQVLAQLTAIQGWGGTWVCNGQYVAITGLSLIHFGAAEQRNVVWEGNVDLASWSGNIQLKLEQLGEFDAGSKIVITYSAAEGTDPQFKIADLTWTNLPGFDSIANEWGVVGVPVGSDMEYSYELKDADVAAIRNNKADWGDAGLVAGLVVYGQQAIVKEIAIVSVGAAAPVETVLWEGSQEFVDWNQVYFGGEGEFAEAGLEVGNTMRIYYTTTKDDWVFEVFGGHWEGLSFAELGDGNQLNPETADPSSGYFQFLVTEDMYGPLTSISGDNWGGGMVIQGDGVIITSITYM